MFTKEKIIEENQQHRTDVQDGLTIVSQILSHLGANHDLDKNIPEYAEILADAPGVCNTSFKNNRVRNAQFSCSHIVDYNLSRVKAQVKLRKSSQNDQGLLSFQKEPF